jgi:hypothetical protein
MPCGATGRCVSPIHPARGGGWWRGVRCVTARDEGCACEVCLGYKGRPEGVGGALDGCVPAAGRIATQPVSPVRQLRHAAGRPAPRAGGGRGGPRPPPPPPVRAGGAGAAACLAAPWGTHTQTATHQAACRPGASETAAQSEACWRGRRLPLAALLHPLLGCCATPAERPAAASAPACCACTLCRPGS